VAQLAWILLPPFAAGVFAIALVWLRSGQEHAADADANAGAGKPPAPPPRAGWLGRAAAAQLPPARFWVWWCGGLSGADAAVVAVWLTVNAVWLAAILKR
jgi:hypothetical protein